MFLYYIQKFQEEVQPETIYGDRKSITTQTLICITGFLVKEVLGAVRFLLLRIHLLKGKLVFQLYIYICVCDSFRQKLRDVSKAHF